MFGITLDEQLVAALAAVAIFLLVGFPVHECAHALVAYRLGDGTAKLFGRLSLNPIVHLDPLGALLLVASALMSGGAFFFGWAKPTPVNPNMLRGGHRGEALVAAAGPLSNLAMAAVAGIAFRLIIGLGLGASDFGFFVANIVFFFVLINVALFLFNLIPIPPLDGSKVLFAALDPRTVWQVRPVLEQWGFLILIVVMFVPLDGSSLGARVILPLLDGITNLLVGF